MVEVRSPYSTSNSGDINRSTDRPVGVGPISTRRSDQGGHVAGVHIGKSASAPASLSRAEPAFDPDRINQPIPPVDTATRGR